MPYHETQAWKRYLQLREERPSAFLAGPLEIITDTKIVDRFAEETGRELGVLYESSYHLLVVDLVRQSSPEERGPERYFAYERLLPAVERGAVVSVPMYGDRFVLLRQFRHAIRNPALSFPRGFGEAGLSAEENLVKELREELGAAEVTDVRLLGTVNSDSGILGNQAEVFFCRVDRLQIVQGYEEIEACVLLAEDELRALIRSGEIRDGFTLSAFTLYLAAQTEPT